MIHNSLHLVRNNLIVLKAFSLFSGLRALQILIGLASTYFVVRALTQTQYGYYQLVQSSVATLTIFSLPEMSNAVMQSLTRGYWGTYRKAVKTVLLSSIVGSLVLVGMGAYYHFARGDAIELYFAFLVAAAIFPVGNGLILWKGLRMAREYFGDLVRLDGINSVLTSCAVILCALLWPGHYLLLVAVYFLGPALRNVVTTIGDLSSTPNVPPAEKGVIAYGAETSAYSGLVLLSERIDNVVLFWFLSPATVALFASADRVAELFRIFTRDLSASMAPRMARTAGYTKRLDDALRLYSLGMGAALVLFTFAILPYLFPLIFTHSYDKALPYAQALVCTVAVGNLAQMRFRYIRSRMDSISYRNVMVFSAIVKLVSLFALVPFFGLLGAVISAFVYRFAMLISVSIVIKRYHVPES